MVTKHLGKGKAILAGLLAGVFSLLLNTFLLTAPAHAASTVQIEWVNATTIRLGGSALQSPVTVTGSFVGNVIGTPAGSETFMASTTGPVDMTFGCKVSMTLDIFPNAQSQLDFSKGDLIFTTSAPSTCSQDTLNANIAGLIHDPATGNANISLKNTTITGVDKRGAASGNDAADKQIVNVTAGMGPASDYNGIPQTDVFMLCEAKGAYVNNIDALYTDCLARKSGTLSANPLTSNNLETLQNGNGPSGSDEKGWKGQFKNVKAGVYVVCSTNFKACQLFTKNPGQIANVAVMFGSTAGSVIPGTPPGQGQGADQKVCTTGEGLAGSLAWILCPAVQLIASATAFFENNIIIPFMTISPLTTNDDNPIYILWQNIRNFMNLAFVGVLLAIIFSQATSIGISNYGIKQMLPRLFVALIAANLSYFIVAFVADAFNIFGAGISQLVMAAIDQAGTTQLNSGTSAGTVRSIFTLGGAALLTIVFSGGAALGWFFSFLGIALLVVVITVVVLVIRQMGFIGLTIVAPVPIILSILPNGKPMLKLWWNTLLKLLLMYPQIVLAFAIGKIFGIVLQQPDFKLAGDGVSDDVAQAIRVILQFLVYVLPLTVVPATFAASGAITGRAYNALNNSRARNFAKKGGSSFNDNVVKPRRQEMQMRAARRGGAVGWAAGYGARRDFKREQRERELGRAKNEYIANETLREGSSLAGSASGIGGNAGATRVQAGAVNQLEKTRHEELANEGAILQERLRQAGISEKEFNRGFTGYVDGTGGPIIQGTTGTVDLSDGRLTRAGLNAAAAAGEVGTVEAARLNPTINQEMVDEIIRNNDGKLKGKGGYHLATNFNLTPGRMMASNGKGEGLDTTGVRYTGAPGQTPAFIDPGDTDALGAEMAKQRAISVANTAAADIADMKSSLLDSLQKSIFTIDPNTGVATGIHTEGANLLASMDPAVFDQLKARLSDIHGNNNLMGKAQNREAIENLYNHLP